MVFDRESRFRDDWAEQHPLSTERLVHPSGHRVCPLCRVHVRLQSFLDHLVAHSCSGRASLSRREDVDLDDVHLEQPGAASADTSSNGSRVAEAKYPIDDARLNVGEAESLASFAPDVDMADDGDQLDSSDFSSSDMRVHVGDDSSDMHVDVDDDSSGMDVDLDADSEVELLSMPPPHELIGDFSEPSDRTSGAAFCEFARNMPENELHLYDYMYAHLKSNTTEAGYAMLRSSHLMEPLRASLPSSLGRFKQKVISFWNVACMSVNVSAGEY